MAEGGSALAAPVERPAGNVARHETDDKQEHAAQMIQRNYRGYRERRQLQGIGLDASARWAEVQAPSILWTREPTLTVG